MKVLLTIALLVGSACSNEPPPASPGTAPSSGSPEGGECSDDVAIQKKCATGLVCGPNAKAPVSEHTPGICKKP